MGEPMVVMVTPTMENKQYNIDNLFVCLFVD